MFTLYTSVAGSLPTTSYVKIIELWLLFHLFVPFLIFLVIFKREHLLVADVKQFNDHDSDKTNIDRLKFLGEKAIPCSTIAFAVVYFTICLIHYYL